MAMVEILQRMTLTMWSAGGQGKARRNAWVAVVANSQQARERNEATEAVWAAERAHRAGTEPLRAQA
jgi:hypothetical protein